MTHKKFELAKSWFTLSQIFMILAGFSFAIFGVAYTNNLQSYHNLWSNLNSLIISENKLEFYEVTEETKEFVENLFQIYGNSIERSQSLMNYSLILGFLFAFLSFLSWINGMFILLGKSPSIFLKKELEIFYISFYSSAKSLGTNYFSFSKPFLHSFQLSRQI